MTFKIMELKVATVENGTVKVGVIPATVLIAMIGIIPQISGLVVEWLQKPAAQEASIELELSKLDLERDREAASLFRLAFSDPDSVQRKHMAKFIVATNLLSSDIDTEALLREEVPQWPAGPEESP
jgi:hypothetical protein